MEAAEPAPSQSPIERILFISAFVSYAICLFAPALTANGSAHPGWVAIAMSPLGLKVGYLATLANPVLWYAWIAKARRKHANAGIASTTALLLALSFLVQKGSSPACRKIIHLLFGMATIFGCSAWH